MEKIDDLLNNKGENYILPFFWQHGEDEETLRNYMEAIQQANCHAVCVESRLHPDFCGAKWWKDMDIILDEARKRDMKVWILDDSHFPTGYANGSIKGTANEFRRQSIYTKCIAVAGKKKYRVNAAKLMRKIPATAMWKFASKIMHRGTDSFQDDQILDVAVKRAGREEPESIEYGMSGDILEAKLPEDVENLYITFLTRNAGINRDYMNMMSHDSCRFLIDNVYEPHYEHYSADFGKTIAGFFSDEPGLGNGAYFTNLVKVGNNFDMPWSAELEKGLREKLGEKWKSYLPLLYDDTFSEELVSRVRLIFMDQITRLVEKNFSLQIGDWCNEHGVEYIGHIIEDNNQHCRTGASLGHYFRSLSGQDMSGIDDIGGQVIPYQEDAPAEGVAKLLGGRDGEFYHYCLGALGASYAAIDPKKKGRCMCEIFGNYGWSEGPRMEKYLIDHFMVQGINRFVPHAFSPKAYPDRDCPPHFYAHGHNPQYRAFGKLMAYTNRVCSLISDGKPACNVAVLYHGEHEWMGETILDQKVLRVLMENQVIAHVIPCDVFLERDRYKTQITAEGLFINGNQYSKLLIPKTDNISDALAHSLAELANTKTETIFVGDYPKHVIFEEASDSKKAEEKILCQKVKNSTRRVVLEELMNHVDHEVSLEPKNTRIRYYHYLGEEEILYIVNEDESYYDGILSIHQPLELYRYDAWNNEVLEADVDVKRDVSSIKLHLKPSEGMIFVVGKRSSLKRIAMENCIQKISLDPGKFTFKVATCKSIDYPKFGNMEIVNELVPYSKSHPKFSGYIAYEITIGPEYTRLLKNGRRMELYIENAGEDVEVFVNGNCAGMQVLPPFYYDITKFLNSDTNVLRIEVATTLERERGVNKKKQENTGIWGKIELLVYENNRKK